MQHEAAVTVRITAAYPESDVAASVWPGVSALRMSLTESTEQVAQVDALVGDWERRRGIRPGTVLLQPAIETAAGVLNAAAIATASPRIEALTGRPAYLALSLGVEPENDAAPMRYALCACDLAARAASLSLLLEEAVEALTAGQATGTGNELTAQEGARGAAPDAGAAAAGRRAVPAGTR